MDRREFLRRGSSASALGLLAPDALGRVMTLPRPRRRAEVRDLVLAAIDAARRAGASYADARLSRVRSQSVSTRERRVQNISSSETVGIGIRVLRQGSWGFAATRELTPDEVARAARQAVEQARANRRLQRRPVVLAPVQAFPDAVWETPIRVDPFEVPIEDKVGLLLQANEAALAVKGARFVNSSLFFHREETTFASTDGSFIRQTLYRVQPSLNVTAVTDDFSDFQSRESVEIAPVAAGYEHVTEAKLVENAPRWAEEAVAKLAARPVEPRRYTLVLHPSHLWLTIHESIGHPTELDRALGYEANYAGTSFLAPPEQVLGKFRYGPELMNIQADRTQERALATTGWDHDGVPADQWLLVKNGIFVDYQTTRDQVAWIEQLTGVRRSHGCSYAESWAAVPFQRMPNVSLLPGEEDIGVDELIADTDDGIYIVGEGSYSIDQQRYNFQFGGQLFYRIEKGKLAGMLKDVAYQSRTPDFWNSLDRIGGPRGYFLGGSLFDGKGQPGQSNAVSHGCVPARFRDVNVLNTGRSRA
ncbi:MAG: TldD/PmbA family protein [Gemmatimonadetes bacterium]|nr:TldD/PmbA family protein [Gemmatimonadota bacterium]